MRMPDGLGCPGLKALWLSAGDFSSLKAAAPSVLQPPRAAPLWNFQGGYCASGARSLKNDIVDDVGLRAVFGGTPITPDSLGKFPVFNGVATGVRSKFLC
jgi:hypothetical protein